MGVVALKDATSLIINGTFNSLPGSSVRLEVKTKHTYALTPKPKPRNLKPSSQTLNPEP